MTNFEFQPLSDVNDIMMKVPRKTVGDELLSMGTHFSSCCVKSLHHDGHLVMADTDTALIPNLDEMPIIRRSRQTGGNEALRSVF